jgi:hypothetical protein
MSDTGEATRLDTGEAAMSLIRANHIITFGSFDLRFFHIRIHLELFNLL